MTKTYPHLFPGEEILKELNRLIDEGRCANRRDLFAELYALDIEDMYICEGDKVIDCNGWPIWSIQSWQTVRDAPNEWNIMVRVFHNVYYDLDTIDAIESREDSKREFRAAFPFIDLVNDENWINFKRIKFDQ